MLNKRGLKPLHLYFKNNYTNLPVPLMKKISTYSIEYQQKLFDLSSNKKDFFFVELGKNSLFNPEPRRSETYTLGFLKEGEIMSRTGLTTKIVKGPAIFSIGPTVVRSLTETENQPIMEIIFFTEDYLMANRSNVFYLMQFDFFDNEEKCTFSLDTEQAAKIEQVFNLIKTTIKDRHLHEQEIVRSCIYILIHETNAFHKSQPAIENQFKENLSPVLIGFRKLLKKEFRNNHSVSFYADKLNITPKHLSEVLKRQSGKTAGEWINEVILLEAKVLLQNKTLSVAQISDSLNFSDQSVFGKFFKTHTLQTPLAYRKATLQ